MPNMTLKELVEKLNKIPKYYGIETESEVVIDAWIAGANDRDYPPGTLVLQCEERNTKVKTPEDIHFLSIYPNRISQLQ